MSLHAAPRIPRSRRIVRYPPETVSISQDKLRYVYSYGIRARLKGNTLEPHQPLSLHSWLREWYVVEAMRRRQGCICCQDESMEGDPMDWAVPRCSFIPGIWSLEDPLEG